MSSLAQARAKAKAAVLARQNARVAQLMTAYQITTLL